MGESKYTTDEFTGNVKVTTSEKEVRVWVCDEKGCQFRFKAMGKVSRSGGIDVMVMAENKSHDDLLAACKAALEFIGRSNKTDWNNEITPVLDAAIAKAEKGK